jgi:hypothetical protein
MIAITPLPKSRTVLAAVATILLACGDDATHPTAAPAPKGPVPAALAIVSGNDQPGKAGEPLPEKLVVLVTDKHGNALPNVPVIWRLTSGAGRMYTVEWSNWGSFGTTYTGAVGQYGVHGQSGITFLPQVLGTSTVQATVAGIRPVVFTTEATSVVIDNIAWGYFLGPNDSTNVTVPVGTLVEWVNSFDTKVIVESTSAPAGGAPFKVVLEHQGERYRFVPQVAGTWEWTYQYFDEAGRPWGDIERGRLTAR